jgi:hypothetical protein
VSIAKTATELEITAETTDESTVELFGLLQTPSGTPIPERRVTVQIDGETIRELSTADGRFSATLDLPQDIQAGDTITVSVIFDGTGTNLEQSVATQEIVLTGSAGSSGDSASNDAGSNEDSTPISTLSAVAIGVGIVVLGSVLLGFLITRNRGQSAGAGGPQSGQPTEQHNNSSDASDTALPTVDDDTRVAITLAVAELRTSFEVPQTATYRALERQVEDKYHSQISTVVDTYERLTFAEKQVDSERARRAVEAARDVIQNKQS